MSVANFTYTGAAQSWTVPAGVTQVVLETWGGGQSTVVRGGYRRVLQTVTPGEALRVNVGQCTGAGAGWNGGGPGGRNGAGGTDVRRGGTTSANRVCVAGGAGAGLSTTSGGRGGSVSGQGGDGISSGGRGADGGRGGSQTAGGSGGASTGTPGSDGAFGVGGASGYYGGGGGFYGGGGGGTDGGAYPMLRGGGGGGSNGGGVGDAVQADQQNVASPDGSLNGYARISWQGAILASADGDNTPPRTQLALIGFSGATATVVRVDADGSRAFVRSANPAVLSAGGWVGYDYEAPFGQPVTYTVTTSIGDTATTQNSVTVDPQTPWLIHPGVPAFSIPIPGVLIPMDEDDDVNQGVHVILGRAEPITITDGQRHSPTFELVIRTDTADDTAAVRRILADTSALLLQVAYDWTTETDYRWMSVGPVKTSRRSQDFSEPGRTFTLQCTETSAPSGLLQAQWTWGDVVATYPTWNDVVAAFPTWNDVILNNPTA